LRSTLIVALIVVAGSVEAFAEPGVPSASATGTQATAGDMRTYKLATGDRITVTVFGQPELSGEFLIDGLGNIHLPLIGTVPVGQVTVEACQERLTEQLARGFLNNPRVSVHVSEFRPVHILGDVRTPGAYPFRFGLSALSAIALAGGVGLSDVRPSTAMAELLAGEERVKVLEATRQTLLVRTARMDAELTGRMTFDAGHAARGRDAAVQPITNSAGGEIATLLQEEQEQLAAGLRAHEQTIGLLKRQKPKLQKEIEATKEQIASETNQLRLSQARLAVYTDLSKRGLGKALTELELRREIAQEETRILRLKAELARLDAKMDDLDVRVQETENARRLRMTTELRDTKLRLREIEASLPVARETLELRRRQVGLVAESDVLLRSYRIILIRGQSGALTAIDGSMPLEPGDILEVRRMRPDPGRGTMTEACGQGSSDSCTDGRAVSLPWLRSN
jgi:polysaccharide biosynthesis/export protein